jgi:hypothetical protein
MCEELYAEMYKIVNYFFKSEVRGLLRDRVVAPVHSLAGTAVMISVCHLHLRNSNAFSNAFRKGSFFAETLEPRQVKHAEERYNALSQS